MSGTLHQGETQRLASAANETNTQAKKDNLVRQNTEGSQAYGLERDSAVKAWRGTPKKNRVLSRAQVGGEKRGRVGENGRKPPGEIRGKKKR